MFKGSVWLVIRNGNPEVAYNNPVLAEMARQNYIEENENVSEDDIEIKDIVVGHQNPKLNVLG